jgi:hypothetical protein
MPAYVVYPLEYDRDLFGGALEIMRQVANPEKNRTAGKRTIKQVAQRGR